MFNNLFADRIGGSNFLTSPNIYRFEQLKRLKREVEKTSKRRIIDFGVGEPDETTSREVISRLNIESGKYENKGYADNGIYEFKLSAKKYLKEMYGVDIDEVKEINHTMGCKAALCILPLVFINPGDYLLTTTPGYPIASNMVKWLDGKVYNLSLKEENDFYPDFDSIPKDILEKSKMLYINYPNNPTGQVGSKNFFSKAVEFAKKNKIVVINDAAYLPLVFNESDRVSFLSVEGAKDVGVEIHTLSKSHNMTGWRIGFVAGNEDIILGFATIKDNFDSGQFIPIQKAACVALESHEFVNNLKIKYARRHSIIGDFFKKHGFVTKEVKGGFYQYLKIPKYVNGKTVENANNFAMWLLKEKQIMTIPYDDEGGYIRLSMTFVAKSIEEELSLINDLKNRLKDVKFGF